MASTNTDFLRFSAYSIKNLLTRKLSENSEFTDQIYAGSNLQILIDLFSYMAEQMLFALNNAAAESMFSDTQMYENMNRLVKFLGYNPTGFTPSTCQFTIDTGDEDDAIIPKYSAIKIPKTDINGNQVYYSFVNNYETKQGDDNTAILYNGVWKMYSTIFTASGTKYETFVLNGLRSDSNNSEFIAHKFIDVYIYRDQQYIQFTGITDDIFLQNDTKYDGDGLNIYSNDDSSRVYTIRLNEDKTYEIKFGNGINGQLLQAGDRIYVFYLDTNGFDGKLEAGEFSGTGAIQKGYEVLGISEDMYYDGLLKINNLKDNISVIDSFNIYNSEASTEAQPEETVEDIREKAPNYYKLGNRLVTKSDYEYYVKNRYSENIIDVLCQNNWDYASTFYAWLYNLGKNGRNSNYAYTLHKDEESGEQYYSVTYAAGTGSNTMLTVKHHPNEPFLTGNPTTYLNEKTLMKYGYKYCDAADSNNVYLWTRLQNNSDVWKKTLKEELMTIKDLTVEPVLLDPVIVNIAICSAPVERALEYLNNPDIYSQFDNTDDGYESYIEITLKENSMFNNATVKNQVANIIVSYFTEQNMKLGFEINLNELLTSIYAIGGIENIRTVFTQKYNKLGKTYNTQYIDGISIATWSNEILDSGEDIQVSNINKTLECFQFPVFYNTETILDKIIVIKRSFSTTTTIQY